MWRTASLSSLQGCSNSYTNDTFNALFVEVVVIIVEQTNLYAREVEIFEGMRKTSAF